MIRYLIPIICSQFSTDSNASTIHEIYQIEAKKSQEAKNDTAKLKKVQDQASSNVDVKKSLINLAMKI